MASSIEERLERYIVRVPEAGCWIWIGAQDGKGYGTLASGHKKSPKKAHRIAYEHYVGPIPTGHVVRHRCDLPACVNPHHLEAGTQKDNADDMVRRGRQNKASLKNLRRDRATTDEMCEQIPRLVHYGISQGELARLFGVNRKTIFNNLKGESNGFC